MYNVKVFTYPDLSRQVRFYSHPIETGIREKSDDVKVPEIEPFTYQVVRDFDNMERSVSVSRNRTVNNIHMYSRSNVWEYFVTFTFASDKVDRYDYDLCSKKLSKWLKNMKQRYCPDMKYIVVPELHKDGAFHFHGLFSDIDGMVIKDSGKRVVKRYEKDGRMRFRRTDEVIYLFGRYKLGWMTATKVKSNERVVKYITKYVTKDLVSHSSGKKRYWTSTNLELPLEDVMLLDSFERFSLQSEVAEVATYVKHIDCMDIRQTVSVYELD